MRLMTEVRRLVDHMESIPEFIQYVPAIQRSDHMGAIITDTILQAGLNYNNVVKPRVNALISNYPDTNTTGGFLELIESHALENAINWHHPEKISRIKSLTYFFHDISIFFVSELRTWLKIKKNSIKIQQIRGIGPKSVDYLKNLVGIPSIAVDRHIRQFVADAGIYSDSYKEIKCIVEYAADLSNIRRDHLDKMIWEYMSVNQSKQLSLF